MKLRLKAQQLERQGKLAQAVDLYSQAISLEPSEREKAKLQKKLTNAKKRWYTAILEVIQGYPPRPKTIELLTIARQLDVENERGWRFKGAVAKAQERRKELVSELGREAEAFAQEKNLNSAMESYGQARELDPALFQAAGLEEGPGSR